MIALLRGRVVRRDAVTVVVDVGGIGYLVHVTPGERVPPQGEQVELHTSLQVREESLTLYGFAQRSALVLFELLLTSSGVGPKLALAAIGTHPPEVLRTAIAGGDTATLTAVPGIGRKVADRLVLELRERVGGLGGDLAAAGATPGAQDAPVLVEVRDALLGLGYSAAEVQPALATLGEPDGRDASALLRAALRALGQEGRP